MAVCSVDKRCVVVPAKLGLSAVIFPAAAASFAQVMISARRVEFFATICSSAVYTISETSMGVKKSPSCASKQETLPSGLSTHCSYTKSCAWYIYTV